MKQPKRPGTPINSTRYNNWVGRFGSYRSGIDRSKIEEWLGQFSRADQDLAARVLDSVRFFSLPEINNIFGTVLQNLPGWHIEESRRIGGWYFSAMSGSSGESGNSMLYDFRVANNLDFRQYKPLFLERNELVSQRLSASDTLVLLDDFSGSGKQVCDAWNDVFSLLVGEVGKIYLVVVAATKQAKQKILQETPISLIPKINLKEKDNLFSERCSYFQENEKNTILRYNKRADRGAPKGFGGCGLLIVFSHRCPNNSIPILHKNNTRWTGLFPRRV